MNNNAQVEYVYSDRYVRGCALPANPPSFWTEVDAGTMKAALAKVLDKATARDADIVSDDELARFAETQRGLIV